MTFGKRLMPPDRGNVAREIVVELLVERGVDRVRGATSNSVVSVRRAWMTASVARLVPAPGPAFNHERLRDAPRAFAPSTGREVSRTASV